MVLIVLAWDVDPADHGIAVGIEMGIAKFDSPDPEPVRGLLLDGLPAGANRVFGLLS